MDDDAYRRADLDVTPRSTQVQVADNPGAWLDTVFGFENKPPSPRPTTAHPLEVEEE